MRLFLAIDFDDKTKNALYGLCNKLKSNSKKGNFSHKENLHFTIAFIGETTKSKVIINTVENLSLPQAFDVEISNLGSFSRYNEAIYFAKINDNKNLKDMYDVVFNALTSKGFELDNREFKPHITLGRQVILKDGVTSNSLDILKNEFLPIKYTISKLSLFKSERINSKLVYTQIYSKSL